MGSETIIDKSKSIKTTLMNLMGNNRDIEGVTNLNACYGGTAALLNSINWLYNDNIDNKYGIVIMADIASYEDGPARPTGGVGAIAILLGNNADITI